MKLNEVTQVLDFMVEIEKLKGVIRKTKPVGLDRYENSAEHSWHVCLSALMLHHYADEPIAIDRVIKMLLIHDLGEIDAGDTIIYASETDEQKSQEYLGIKRVLALLPNHVAEGFLELWQEFEAGETPDAKFAKAVDRIPPLLHNLHGDGHSWKKHNVKKEKILAFNGARIGTASQSIWQALETQLKQGFDAGMLD